MVGREAPKRGGRTIGRSGLGATGWRAFEEGGGQGRPRHHRPAIVARYADDAQAVGVIDQALERARGWLEAEERALG